jgi:hypothetical protein
MLNYHEMTMNEPRNSKARRQQYLVICSVMASAFVYSLLTSGALLDVTATEGVFPGGNFCYKFATRDYAASTGTGRRIAYDWATVTTTDTVPPAFGEESKDVLERKKEVSKKIYHVYLDNPMQMGGTQQRYMTGVLVSDADKATYCDPLFTKNSQIERTAHDKKGTPYHEKSVAEVYDETKYEYVDLPSVDSLVVQFPFTDGFVSSLVFSYKVWM